MRIQKGKLLLYSILICQGTGILGSFFTTSSVNGWYLTLNKPSFNPPSWLFAPVWTILFLLMGISMYLVWLKVEKNKQAQKAFWLFLLHLLVNIGWSALFFGLKRPDFALVGILFLWAFIARLVFLFGQINKKAGWLLVPYWAWVSFASLLNFYLYKFNL